MPVNLGLNLSRELSVFVKQIKVQNGPEINHTYLVCVGFVFLTTCRYHLKTGTI